LGGLGMFRETQWVVVEKVSPCQWAFDQRVPLCNVASFWTGSVLLAALWSKHFIRVLDLDLISARAAKVLSFGGARILIERILVLWWCLGLSCTGLFV
jgi:hypothetical protein